MCHHTHRVPQESPPSQSLFLRMSFCVTTDLQPRSPGNMGCRQVPGTPNPAPLCPLPFQPGNHPGPTSHSWLHGKCRGREGASAPRLTSPTPLSPLSPHECNISFLAVTREAVPEGLLTAGEAEGCSVEKRTSVPRRRVGTARPQKFKPQALSEGEPFFSALVFSALLPRRLPLPSPSLRACGRRGRPSDRG